MKRDIMQLLEGAMAAAEAREADPEWQQAMRAQEARQARENALWPYKASGISRVLKSHDLDMLLADGAQATVASKLIREWTRQALNPDARGERWRPWLWVGGPPGCGKTIAAAEAIGKLCPWMDCQPDQDQRPKRPRYVLFRELMDAERLLRSFNTRDRERAEEAVDSAVRGDVVVLDEVGEELEADKDMARLALNRFVDLRQSSHGLTLVLTNKSGAAMEERFTSEWYDQRTASRLRALLSRGPDGAAMRDVVGQDLRGAPLMPRPSAPRAFR